MNILKDIDWRHISDASLAAKRSMDSSVMVDAFEQYIDQEVRIPILHAVRESDVDSVYDEEYSSLNGEMPDVIIDAVLNDRMPGYAQLKKRAEHLEEEMHKCAESGNVADIEIVSDDFHTLCEKVVDLEKESIRERLFDEMNYHNKETCKVLSRSRPMIGKVKAGVKAAIDIFERCGFNVLDIDMGGGFGEPVHESGRLMSDVHGYKSPDGSEVPLVSITHVKAAVRLALPAVRIRAEAPSGEIFETRIFDQAYTDIEDGLRPANEIFKSRVLANEKFNKPSLFAWLASKGYSPEISGNQKSNSASFEMSR